METPSIRNIVVRAVYLIAALVILLFGFSFYKKTQRRTAVVSDLRALTSDSSYFHQFYPEDARKALVRAMGLLADGERLGLTPEDTIERALDLQKGVFDERDPKQDADPKTLLVLDSLQDNYANTMKLGYSADHQTVTTLKTGELPTIPSGPQAGRRPVIAPIIDPALSPGLDKVVANLSIRPPGQDGSKRSDVEIAAAKQLAGRFASAGVIEREVGERIHKALSAPKKSDE